MWGFGGSYQRKGWRIEMVDDIRCRSTRWLGFVALTSNTRMLQPAGALIGSAPTRTRDVAPGPGIT